MSARLPVKRAATSLSPGRAAPAALTLGAAHPAPPQTGRIPGRRGAGSPAGGQAPPSIPPAGHRGDPAPLTPALLALAKTMSEEELERRMLAIIHGIRELGITFLAWHPWKLHTKRAAIGYPDWTLASCGGHMFRELKREHEKPTKAQQEWLDTLRAGGADADVWRPSSLLSGRVARELTALAGLGGGR